MNYEMPLLDICERKHGGNAESIAANPSTLSKSLTRERILMFLAASPSTAKELAKDMGVALHCISGRCSELKALGQIVATGERRDKSSVLRLAL